MEKSKYPQDTNIVTPGPTLPIIYNKVDYSDKTLPIEYNNYQKYDNILIEDNKRDKLEEYNFINEEDREVIINSYLEEFNHLIHEVTFNTVAPKRFFEKVEED